MIVYYVNVPFDTKFEDLYIKEEAKEIYEKILQHADRRMLDQEYVVSKFIYEIKRLVKGDGYSTE